jgi:hypothetical protein
MKKEQTLKKSLKFLGLLVASLLAVQAAHALPGDDQKSACTQALQDLQDKMASLNSISAPEDLISAEASIVGYQSALAQRGAASDAYVSEMQCAAGTELVNVDCSNPLGLLSGSVTFGDFENTLLNARVGAANPEAFVDENNFYKNNEDLFDNVMDSFMAYQTDLLNVDPQNPLAVKQVKEDGKEYAQAVEKIQSKAHQYKKSELQDAVNAAALTPEEQQLWNQFQSTLAEKCKTARANYRATPTFGSFPWVEVDLENLDPTNPAARLQVKLEEKEAIHANIGTFNLLVQGCRYEFLNVLLTKRNDTDSSLNSFHQLQGKLAQFLNNVDLNNLVPALQAQVDMLAYEKEVKAVTTAPAVK